VAGAVELAWFQTRSGTIIAPINDGGLITTTVEGGAGGADTAQTWYSTTARASVPVTILGYFDSLQATAGTWATAAAVLVVNPRFRPNDIVQTQFVSSGTVATGTTLLPYDDTIPQSGEGIQFQTLAITPTAAANVLEIECAGFGSVSAGGVMSSALFQDATAGALVGLPTAVIAANSPIQYNLKHRMLAATTSATTMKLRVGSSSAATTTWLGASGAGRFGGVGLGSMRILERAA